MKIVIVTDQCPVETGTGTARYANELVKGLREENDVEVIGSCGGNPLRSVLTNCVSTPIRVLRRAPDYELLHACAPINALPFPLLQTPNVVTYHDIASLLFGSGSHMRVRLAAPYLYSIGRYCDAIIAVSSQTKRELVDRLHIPEAKIKVINNGVQDRFKPLPHKDSETFTIGFIGVFHARKRIDFLLRAFHYLKTSHPEIRVRLKLYGQPNMKYAELVKLAHSLDVSDDAEFCDRVPEEELVFAYNSFDVFVLPSEWEGFGLPILEAQRCGVPVVIRKDAHIPEEVGHLCVKATSEQDMADLIYDLLKDQALRDHIIKEGLEYSKGFTWDKTVQETISVYKEVIAR